MIILILIWLMWSFMGCYNKEDTKHGEKQEIKNV